MARCRHGFEPTPSVRCPVGCHGTTTATSAAKTARGITNQQIVDALAQHGSLKGAAKALGISRNTIDGRAKSCVAVRDALAAVRGQRVDHG